ncbi:prophage DNA circulation protein [Azospirillum baldaniorum]|uniref:DNA circularization protein n=1 Tax=Azospirillum baldaniorum TaxID=1064539 RepID=UPI0011A0C7C9|nr:DNA circularization N-terminal domain-containing protein [Azospirillum baldaniorum]TWA69738.1 prophage DNA circulation protein [Azospirillum baldaniorum]
MTWRDQLRPASFRGVPFKVDGDELAAGRRVQLHEYPQRDKPYAEDLGRATRKITLTAYLIGPDYMAQRDRLLAALEEAGPGELVHPQYGTLQVVADGECRVAHSRDEGGLCRFSLSFAESGELAFPSATVNTSATCWRRADALAATSLADFAAHFGVAGVADFVRAGAIADVVKAVGMIERTVRGFSWSAVLGGLLGDLDGLLGSPSTLAQRIMALFTGTGTTRRSGGRGGAVAGSSSLATAGPTAQQRLASLGRVAAYVPPSPTYATVTPARRQQARNSAAVAALVRRAALVQSARVAADAEWPVYQEAITERDALAQRIDAEALRPDVPDATFRALTDLRVAVVQDLTARSVGAARLATVTPATVQPAVVLAYDLYEDAGRGEEIVTRNRVAHPGFVPPAPLKVLT